MFEFRGQTVSSGTSLVGYVEATYEELVYAFGEPTYDDPSADDKVSTEWNLKFYDEDWDREVIATIYDWKDYDGGKTSRSGKPYRWHVGGKIPAALWAVQEHLGIDA